MKYCWKFLDTVWRLVVANMLQTRRTRVIMVSSEDADDPICCPEQEEIEKLIVQVLVNRHEDFVKAR